MTGHWEIMGVYTTQPSVTFTDTGFPQELIDELEKRTGYKYIGNCAASGTEIIKELGERQLKTKELIIYTSADSVLQIAAHEELFGLDEIYRVCSIAREICSSRPDWMVGRIIARPFVGTNKDNFERTPNRHDYALSPSAKTILDSMKEKGYDVISIGKINLMVLLLTDDCQFRQFLMIEDFVIDTNIANVIFVTTRTQIMTPFPLIPFQSGLLGQILQIVETLCVLFLIQAFL